MITPDLIARGGSKLEVTKLFLEKDLGIPIPQSLFLYSGDSLKSVETEFKSMKKPVMVRPSHKNDWHGLVGVLPTIEEVYTRRDLSDAVKKINSFMKTKRLEKYVKDEALFMREQGLDYDCTQNVHFLIQERADSLRGSMLRHPNNPDKLLIRYNDFLHGRGHRNRDFVAIVNYYEDKRLLEHKNRDASRADIAEKEIFQLIDMYKTIETSGLLEDCWSYQMEFGLSPLFFFQIRPFKKFDIADFHVSDYAEPKDCSIRLENTFGITKGLKLPFKVVDYINLEQSTFSKPSCNFEEPYCLILRGTPTGDDMPINFPIGKLEAYIIAENDIMHDFNGREFDLSHGRFRFMKRAKVSGVVSRDCFHTGLEGSMEIISDGNAGLLISEKGYE